MAETRRKDTRREDPVETVEVPREVVDVPIEPRVTAVLIGHNQVAGLRRAIQALEKSADRDRLEIIVIDNGSRTPPHQRDFAHLHANIRVLSCSTRSPSPVAAINEGLKLARGSLIGVWIDGARMASPGLLRACKEAAALHPRPVIATRQPARQTPSGRGGRR